MENYTVKKTQMQESFKEDPRLSWKEHSYEIVSTVSYLAGVGLPIFENEYEPPKLEIFHKLEARKPARIVRNLCRVRTAIEHKFGPIYNIMKCERRSLYGMPDDLIPQDALRQLDSDGVVLAQKPVHLSQYIIDINRLLADRLNNVRNLFPDWLHFQYVRTLFLVPQGLTETGIRAAANNFFQNMPSYPYGVFLNLDGSSHTGNLFANDTKLIKNLYRMNGDEFCEYNRVSDVSDYVKDSMGEFIANAGKSMVIIDCENSDPFCIRAALGNLDAGKIAKILLVNDIHTSTAWGLLEEYTTIPVENVTLTRVQENKSLSDVALTALLCKAHFSEGIDSFLLASSDSDFWGVISALPTARFLLLVERNKCSKKLMEALQSRDIFFCYIENFHTDDTLKQKSLFREIQKSLQQALQVNMYDVLERALMATRVPMSAAQRQQFAKKYLMKPNLIIDKQGNASLELKI